MAVGTFGDMVLCPSGGITPVRPSAVVFLRLFSFAHAVEFLDFLDVIAILDATAVLDDDVLCESYSAADST